MNVPVLPMLAPDQPNKMKDRTMAKNSTHISNQPRG